MRARLDRGFPEKHLNQYYHSQRRLNLEGLFTKHQTTQIRDKKMASLIESNEILVEHF